MSIEAMQQALNALEYHTMQTRPIHHTDKAIEALRQAIEEAEKQEPVAWMVRDSIDGSWYPCAFENPAGAIKGESKPLYAVPQQAKKQEPVDIHCPSCLHSFVVMPVAKREWVGLTDEEILDLWIANHKDTGATDAFARAIEAKLKEKNGG